MTFAAPSTLLLAALIDSSALYHAFVLQDLDPASAMTRYLIAVPVSALMIAGLRFITRGYQPARSGLEALTGGPEATSMADRRRATD
jgi:hypothetical protein